MKKIILTMGVFDGLHRGHRHLFQRVIRRAKAVSGISVVYTFDPHPARLLAPASCPPMIMTLKERLKGIQGLGIDRVIVQKFTRRFARLSPEAFFDSIVLKKIKPSEILIGYNFTFGHHRRGTPELLEALARARGVRVTVVGPYLWKETLVSSTQVRELLRQGHCREAGDLLGHPYQISGMVIRGRGIGGKLLGIHTANLRSKNDSILPTGVYATRTIVKGRPCDSVTNIGPNPTFGPGTVSIETHLMRFNRTILGRSIEIRFFEKIREEITFSSPKELANQIHRDIEAAKQCLRKC